MLRLHAFNRRFLHCEPTAAELATFEADKKVVQEINAAIEREEAARALTRADMQAQLASILREEQEAVSRIRPRRRQVVVVYSSLVPASDP